MLLTDTATATDASARASSCMASEYATTPAPAPPSSSGTLMPRRPISASSRSSRSGKLSVRSRSAAAGASTR